MNVTHRKLLKLASDAAKSSYSPYSGFVVGAAVLYEDGRMYAGCNVENASYGLTICAEMNAISTAVADGQKKGLMAVAIYSPNCSKCYPCGACRQWIKEFSVDADVVVEDIEGNCKVFKISELLPNSFEL